MAERTVDFVSDGRCMHCGMTHEPWLAVCPVSRLPVRSTPPTPPVIPAAPRIPAAPVRAVIPPAPAIPKAAAGVMPRGSHTPRTTPAMGIPCAPAPFAQQALPRVVPAAPAAPVAALSPVVMGRELVGRVIGDRYGVTGVIGEGGMGAVYEAEHLTIGKLVAIKVLHPHKAQSREAVSRLRHEARVAGTLGHPNICAVYDLGRLDDGSPYLVMERLHGETLAQRIARVSRLATSDMVDIMLQVLSALAAAHQRGVVHRDLKPENIFLSQRAGMRPTPKLLDFGISKAEDIEETVADASLAAGTPFYMAPEQARGERGVDWRVDLWSAGVVLYEGLTGRRPFVAKNYNALLVQILSVQQRSIRELDPELHVGLAKVVDRALGKRPEDRHQSALEFQNALRSYRELETEGARRVVPVIASEPTSDDGDATTVFHRMPLNLGAPPSVEDDQTPIYAPDDERTVVETPPFLAVPMESERGSNETVVMPRPQMPGAGRKS